MNWLETWDGLHLRWLPSEGRIELDEAVLVVRFWARYMTVVLEPGQHDLLTGCCGRPKKTAFEEAEEKVLRAHAGLLAALKG